MDALEPILVWAACGICDETWTEDMPDIGERTQQLMKLVCDDLGDIVTGHRRDTHSRMNPIGYYDGIVPQPVLGISA